MKSLSTRGWNVVVGAGLLASVGFVVGFNYVVDPYEIFQTKNFRAGASTNERFNKVEHLLSHKDDYNGLIVGSSVMGAYEPSWFNDEKKGLKVYNGSFMGGTPNDAYKLVSVATMEGMKIKEIWMGIDIFPFMQADDSSSPSKRHHYLVDGTTRVKFYSSYLFASSLWHGFSKVMDSGKKVPNITYDIEGTGRYFLVKQDEEMKQDIDGYVKRKFGSREKSVKAKQVAWVNERFDELKTLVGWANAHQVKTHFYIQPFHRLLKETVPKSVMADFKQRIFEITGEIPDFTERTDITDNDALYYDPKHYVPSVARMIAREI